jgi:hypothetical protein
MIFSDTVLLFGLPRAARTATVWCVDVKSSTRRTARGLVRAELQRLHASTFPGPAGTLRQRGKLTPDQHQILGELGLPDPLHVLTVPPADQRVLVT